MVTLKLKLKESPPALRFFSKEDLALLAASFTVELPAGCEMVFIGENPPNDLKLRWQKTDSTGALVGQIKSFNGIQWV